MKENHLHIIALNIPYPDNYGGVIDIFQKIKALKKANILIHLHCFEYNRKRSPKLNVLCESVHYYKRNIHWKYLLSPLPFIVKTRNNSDLISRLLEDDYPILFEGIHTSFWSKDKRLKNRLKILRSHNIEHDYYKALYNAEKHFFKKYFYFLEYLKLKKFEVKLNHFHSTFAISEKDKAFFSRYNNTFLIKAFHKQHKIENYKGLGKYAVFHGNLEVLENQNAALFFIKEVFNDLKFPLIIAGKNPSSFLIDLSEKYDHITIIENPSDEELDNLIKNAQINVLRTEQDTGVKLKLLKALFIGRHCLLNNLMLSDKSLTSLCHIANTVQEWKEKINFLKTKPFDELEIEKRKLHLTTMSNAEEAQKIKNIIF
ncbi:MAG: hypothetical protein ACON4Y_01700 [Flavobacteriales bacterium]